MVQDHLRDRCVCWSDLVRLRRVTHVKDSYGTPGARALLLSAWIIALASAVVLYRFALWFHHPIAAIGVTLALGGAAGNLLDILRWRYVLDFIDLGWWPVFNLADVGIVVGVGLSLWKGMPG